MLKFYNKTYFLTQKLADTLIVIQPLCIITLQL